MSGEVKDLRHPRSSRHFHEITPMEWFRAKFNGISGVAMIVSIPGAAILNSHSVLFVQNDGTNRHLTIDTLRSYRGEFLGYLTTEDSVQIFGSLDPAWKPSDDPATIDPDIYTTSSIPIGMPFVYTFHGDYRDEDERDALKLPSNRNKDKWVLLTIYKDGRESYVDQSDHTDDVHDRRRKLVRLSDPSALAKFRDHLYLKYAIRDGYI